MDDNEQIKKAVEARKFVSSTNAYSPHGEWKTRLADWLFLFGPFLLLMVIFLIGTFFVVREFFPSMFERVAVEDVQRSDHVEPLESNELPTADELISRLLQAHGGRGPLMDLSSIQMNGALTIEGKPLDFYLTRKKPGRALLKIKSDSFEITDGAINGVHWRRSEYVGKPTEYKLLGEGEVSNLGKDIDSLYDPLLAYALESGVKKGTVRKSSYAGKATYLYLFVNEEGRNLQAEINADTFLTMAIREPLVVEGSKRELLMEFSDYRLVDTIFIPFQTELSLDGAPLQTINVRTAKINYGVISSLFELPDALKQQL